MAGEWPSVPLGSLADDDGAIAIGPFGSAMKADTYVSRGVPIIRGTNISSTRELNDDWVYVPEAFADAMPRCVVRDGDLVFPHRGSIGEVALVPGDHERYFLSTSCMKITLDRQKADPRYVAYYFKSKPGRAEIMRFASQVGTPGIGQPLTSLRQFSVPAPSVHVQRAIADLLSSLDDKIEVNRRMAGSLEAMARALFKSWFVDFDPVHAKVEGRPTGLPDRIAALFPYRFEEDGLPNGWITQPLNALLRNVVERVQPSPQTAAKPYVPIDAIAAKSLAGIEPKPGIGAQSSLVAFEPDDILFGAMRPYFHKVALAPFAGTTRTTVFVLRPHLPVDLSFALLTASEDSTIEFATNSSSGSTIPYAVWNGSLSTMAVTMPPPELRTAFNVAVLPTLRRAQSLLAQSRTLADLRDTLLPKLISGELRIEKAGAHVSAA